MNHTPVGARPMVRRTLFVTALILLAAWVATLLGGIAWIHGRAPGPLGSLVHLAVIGVPEALAQATDNPATQVPEPPEPPEPPDPSGIPKITIGKSGNITRIGSDIEIGPDQVVDGDVVAVGGDVTIYGRVEGDVAAMGGDVHLMSSADVDGDVVCMGGRLVEESGARVGGQRVSGLGRGRTVIREGWKEERHRENRLASSLANLLLMAGAAWGFASLGPGRTRDVMATLRRESLMSFGIGTLVVALLIPSIVALALVVALLCITIIGIPVALAALLGYCLFLVLIWIWGYVAAAAVVGEGILTRRAASAPPGATPAAPPTLVNAALLGVLVFGGSALLGALLRETGGFLSGFGTLIRVLAMIAMLLLSIAGSGAWLRTEFRAGTIARWWRGSQWGRPRDAASTPPPPPSPPPVAPPPPPPAPSPAAAFMPPGPSPGASGSAPPTG